MPIEEELAVNAGERVFVNDTARSAALEIDLAKASDVDSEQLEFGRQRAAGELARLAAKICGHDLGHFVAGSHQAVDFPSVESHLPDGIHARIGGSQGVVHYHAALGPNGKAGRPR
ncbi:hypothetical protein HRbin30_01950 [bacterium HR30]|nr:hypothetical protein HRbin30_01950 [bacterium HR30]